jgi:transcriptional regulator with XRE-family HTH domain
VALAENIKVRRSALSLTQSELAKSAGVSQQLIDALEKGKIRTTKFIPEIALALGCGVKELDSRYGMSAVSALKSAYESKHDRELPVLGATDDIPFATYIVIPDEPVDYLECPAPLSKVRGAYAVIVPNQVMTPEFGPGDLALVNPHLPPMAGTTCIFYCESESGKIAKMRRITGFTANEWHVTQWNPPLNSPPELTLDRNQWRKCHPIVGRFNRT